MSLSRMPPTNTGPLERFCFVASLFVALLTPHFAYGQVVSDQASKQSSLDSAAKEFVNQLVAGEFDKATQSFDKTMSAALTPVQLKAIWNSLTQSVGNFERTTHVRHLTVDVYDIVFVTCKFGNASLDAKVVFDQQQRITGLFFLPVTMQQEYRAPDYVNSSSFAESEITFGDQPWTLSGTLSVPKQDSKRPAVILVHGSGPNDRDETVGANKPFKDIAGGLASRGIAVLRYDKRTKTHGAKMPKNLTVKEETIDDVIAAVNWLSKQPSVDPNRIVVLGHSLGGYLIPRIAKADKEGRIAGYIIMAGNSRPLEDLIKEQTSYILGLDGELSESDRATLGEIDGQVHQVKSIASASEPAAAFGASKTYWIDLDGYQPHVEAGVITQPILILQGERDYQVTMQDFANWRSVLADRKEVRMKSYPALNHLMIEGTGPSQPAEYQVAGNVAGDLIQDIAEWIERI